MGRVLLAGATVWAGPACVPSRAWMLVEDGRVAAVAGREPLPPVDRVVDLPGCDVLPGFVDVHVHLSQAAWIPRGGDGWGWRGLGEALRAVRAAGHASPQAPWLLFWNVARWSWPEGRLPTSGELDEAAPGRRVLVSSSDLHRGSVSSAGHDHGRDAQAVAVLVHPGRHHVVVETAPVVPGQEDAVDFQSGLFMAAFTTAVTYACPRWTLLGGCSLSGPDGVTQLTAGSVPARAAPK